VVYGTDPGGRLPVTFGRRFADYPVANKRRYPGIQNHVQYDEGVFVGYRGFDHDGVSPLFPFGHGLSYAEFTYENPTVEHATDELVDEGTDSTGSESALGVSVTVENRADRPGREVVQAYVSPPSTPEPVTRPERELGGFVAVKLDNGERRRVSLSVPHQAFARYDARDGWTVDPGEYAVVIGRSSRDDRLRKCIELD
jgi:beta-glucosidase